MKKLLSFIAVTVTAATAVAAGAYIITKLKEDKDEEVKLIEIINADESEKKTKIENTSADETVEEIVQPTEKEIVKEPSIEMPICKDAEEKAEEYQETMEETATVEETVDRYPSVSERKKIAIRNQIKVMLESMDNEENADLQHFVVFPNAELGQEYITELNDAFEVEVENEGTEVNLTKNTRLDYALLEDEILTLAEKAIKYSGVYKGWAIKSEE